MALPKLIARRPILACGLTLAVIAGIAFVALRFSPDSSNGAPLEPQTPSEPIGCDDSIVKEMCFTIESGGSVWRYAYYPGASETNETVIFDPGGPGVSVLSGQYNLEQLRMELGSEYHLLVVEEPWVTAEIPEECTAESSNYYRSLREDLVISPANAHDWGAACSAANIRLGFTAESYAATLEAIVAKHNLDPVGFLGHSFASARLAYLTDTSVGKSLQWAVISRPFPVGTSIDELIESRAAAVKDYLGEFAFEHDPDEIDTRSLAVTDFDYWSALIGLGYVHDDNLLLAINALSSGTDPATVGALSDQLWMRYGIDSISPGMVAQMQEVCSATLPSESSTESIPRIDDGPEGILTAQMLPCTSFGASTDNLGFQENLPICVAISNQDLVAPADLANKYFQPYEIVETASRSHGSSDGWEECQQKIAGGD